MRKTLARVVAGVALAVGLIGFTGVAQASASDFDSGYQEPTTSSGKAMDPTDLPSSVEMYNNFNAAGGEIGHGVATGVSSAYFGAPIAAAEYVAGIAKGAKELAGLG